MGSLPRSIISESGREVFLPTVDSIKTIVDLGCFNGITIEAYAKHYPDAFILGVELMPDNYMIAKDRLSYFEDRVILKNSAVWSYDGDVICSVWGEETSHIVESRKPTPLSKITLPCATLDTLTSSLDKIDFIKFDIEASEHEVLGLGGDWVKKTRSVFIEIHDETNDNVRNLVLDLGFKIDREEFEKIWASK